MKREFFAGDVAAALEKASLELGIPVEQLTYRVLDQKFGSALTQRKVGVIVEMETDEKPLSGPPTSMHVSQEEIRARSAGDADRAAYLLDGIFHRMRINTKTTYYEKGEHVVLAVQLLDGELDLRRGRYRELRGALQHLINRAVSKQGEPRRRFIVDIGGTLEDRSQKMTGLANDLVDAVLRLGQQVHIHLMDSQDRRLLHLGLTSNANVTTQGQGEKQYRILSAEPVKGHEILATKQGC